MLQGKEGVFLILHNIRSVYNVGSIFRSADAIAVTKIYLTGYPPAPVDRFGRSRKDFSKVSLGAEKSVLWETRKNIRALLRELKQKHVRIVALEQHSRSVDYKKVKVRTPAALILGNEVVGVPEWILKWCDSTAEIPMRGGKGSLNVAVAAGIALFRFFDRN